LLKQIILTLAAPKPKLKSLSRSLKPTKFSQTPRVKKLTTKLETNSRTNMLVVPKAKEQVHTVTVTKLMKLKQGHMAPNQGKAQAAISPKATRESPSSDPSNLLNNQGGIKGQANATNHNSINTIIATDAKSEDMRKTEVNSLENIVANMDKHRSRASKH
jgi:hypothetical protein